MKLIYSFILISSFQLFGATYYVRTDGNDANAGTTDSAGGAYLTVTKSVSVAVAGDTVNIGAGTFDENVSVNIRGTAASPVVFRGTAAGAIVRRFVLSSASYITITNLVLKGTGGGFNPKVESDASCTNITVINCHVDSELHASPSQGAGGIWLDGQTMLVSGNTVSNVNTSTGIRFNGTNCIATNNLIIHCQDADAFRVWGMSNVFVANLLTNFYGSTNGAANHSDIIQTYSDIFTPARYITFERNKCYDMTSQICYLEAGSVSGMGWWTMRNNLYVRVSHMGQAAMPAQIWANNTFYQCGNSNSTAGEETSYPHALEIKFTISGNSTNTTLYNNAFIECGYTNGTTTYGWYQTTYGSNAFITADYNFVTGTNGQTKTGFSETHGINGGSAGFTSLGTDFSLATGSQMIGSGLDLSASFTTDIENRTRIIPFEIGAYEYQSPPTYRGFSFGPGVQLIGPGSVRQ